ncbi:unnamed protein product [Dovyalis caffra]|uniref:Uncharacterized protein n=1 Tax=Dovyalis caffra TaxID=77055 RepID=A0AAV1RCP8_9ROSI|nr:unnamed protein product [Dovyalis caffra]
MEGGAALLGETTVMGDPEAQYELGCRLRVEGHAGAVIANGPLLLRVINFNFGSRLGPRYSSPSISKEIRFEEEFLREKK